VCGGAEVRGGERGQERKGSGPKGHGAGSLRFAAAKG
jgi:hypothetical protein